MIFGIVGFGAIAIAIVRNRARRRSAAIAGATGDANVFGSVADFGNALFTHEPAAV